LLKNLRISEKSCNFAGKIEGKDKFMSTFTIQIPVEQVSWFEQMIQTMGWTFRKKETSSQAFTQERQTITPAMRRRINKARKDFAEGQTTTCRTPQEMQQFFDSL
jgi:hypothetical protein